MVTGKETQAKLREDLSETWCFIMAAHSSSAKWLDGSQKRKGPSSVFYNFRASDFNNPINWGDSINGLQELY